MILGDKNVCLGVDEFCVTQDRIDSGKVGGTERFFLFVLKPYLEDAGFRVFHYPMRYKDDIEFDVVIHSNLFNSKLKGKKHILWAGSWHASGCEHVDLTICVSEFFKRKMGWSDAIVIYPPFDHNILQYKTRSYMPGTIFCHSNPNRHIAHTIGIASQLVKKDIKFRWDLTGGNKLYSDNYNDRSFGHAQFNIYHHGTIPRIEVLGKLTNANLFVYPNMSDESETFCVCASEAMALGVPTLLPRREPFISLFPEAEKALTEMEMVYKIECMLDEEPRKDYDVGHYDDRAIMPKFIKAVEGLI